MVTAILLMLTGCGGGGTVSGVFDQPPRAPRIPIARKVFGLNFGPYVLAGQDPNTGVTIPVNQLNYLVKTAAPYTTWIRTFGTTNGLERALTTNGTKDCISGVCRLVLWAVVCPSFPSTATLVVMVSKT